MAKRVTESDLTAQEREVFNQGVACVKLYHRRLVRRRLPAVLRSKESVGSRSLKENGVESTSWMIGANYWRLISGVFFVPGFLSWRYISHPPILKYLGHIPLILVAVSFVLGWWATFQQSKYAKEFRGRQNGSID